MDLTTHLRTFDAVARCGSFSEAARRLGVVPSVIAKRIVQLEAELQTRLFERTTRKVTLTEAGDRLQGHAARLVTELDELLAAVKRDDTEPEGHLRVMAPTTLTLRSLGATLTDFLVAHPRITMELVLVDRSANPAEGGFDLAISGRDATYEGIVDVPLAPVRPLLCAAPAYLLGLPALAHPRELAERTCLVFSATGTTWTFDGGRGAVSVDVHPRLLADDNLTVLRAAVAGLGIALLPAYVVGSAVRDGTLVPLLPRFSPKENWFKAYVPRRKLHVARVKVLLAYLQQHWVDRFTAESTLS